MTNSSLPSPAVSAIRHLSLSFRAGLALRPSLDSALRNHGTAAWQTASAQARLLSETVFYRPNPCPPKFTFGTSRIAKFVKLLMHEVDLCKEAEWDEGLLQLAEDFCRLRPGAGEGEEEKVYVVFEMPSGIEVVLRVSKMFNQLGKRVWESGLVIRASMDNGFVRGLVKGRRVLEIGAGTGVTAGGYVDAGVEMAMLTDVDEGVVENLVDNISEGGPVCVGMLDLLDTEKVRGIVVEKSIEVLIVADLTYDIDLIEGLIHLLGILFEKTSLNLGIVALLERTEISSKVGEMLESIGLRVSTSVDDNLQGWCQHFVGWELQKVKILQITKSSGG